MTNVRGIINDVIRDASAEIGTVGPQVMSFIHTVCLSLGLYPVVKVIAV